MTCPPLAAGCSAGKGSAVDEPPATQCTKLDRATLPRLGLLIPQLLGGRPPPPAHTHPKRVLEVGHRSLQQPRSSLSLSRFPPLLALSLSLSTQIPALNTPLPSNAVRSRNEIHDPWAQLAVSIYSAPSSKACGTSSPAVVAMSLQRVEVLWSPNNAEEFATYCTDLNIYRLQVRPVFLSLSLSSPASDSPLAGWRGDRDWRHR